MNRGWTDYTPARVRLLAALQWRTRDLDSYRSVTWGRCKSRITARNALVPLAAPAWALWDFFTHLGSYCGGLSIQQDGIRLLPR